MNDNLDDWLNSLGIESVGPANNDAEEAPADSPSLSTTVPEHFWPEPEVVSQSLSEDDFDDILEDFGFAHPEDAQAEEIREEESNEEGNSDVYDENAGEGRDLDAEEDADWQEAIDSGGVTPISMTDPDVHFHMPDGEVISVPVIHEEDNALQAPAPHGDEVTPDQDSLIPLNSPTLLLDESTTRFSGAEWYNEIQSKHIILAGLGGIGSWLALQLARMVPASLALYDDDRVEMVNMAGQLYSRNDIGKSKVSAVSGMISSYTSMQNVYAIQERFTEADEAGDIMMCGFDSMAARKTFFDAWHDHMLHYQTTDERRKCLFIDGRLSIDTLQVFCVTGDNEYACDEYYNKYLFSDAEAEETRCSLKQTTYLASMIGSVMVNLFTNWCADSLDPDIPYDLPFFTEYDAQNMIFKTIK